VAAWRASRRRRSAGARSSGSEKAAKASRERRTCWSWCSSSTERGETAAGRGSGRRRPSGSRSSRRRSGSSALAKSSTSRIASAARRPWRSAQSRSLSWSLWPSSHRAHASVGPMARWASLRSAAGDRREPSARRDSTQPGLWPSSRAMPLGVSPSSSARERTTLASSRAVVVRGGALASSRSRLCSAGSAGRSTTTGTLVEPCSRQRSRRLKPSRTSKQPSSVGATRSGSSASCSGAPGLSPGRSLAKLVRSRSTDSDRTVLAADGCGSDMGLPSRRRQCGGAEWRRGLRDQPVRMGRDRSAHPSAGGARRRAGAPRRATARARP